jgi:TonB-dependent receptor
MGNRKNSNWGNSYKSVEFKRSVLAMCVMALSASAFAQDAPKKDEVEEVIITGMKEALGSAQSVKKNADTIVDSIDAKDLGSFPDKSVAEALQRVAGITVNRFAASSDTAHFSAEPSGVVVRGLNQVRTEFNGRDSFSANSGRGLSWGDISPELMSGVDTYKNQTAELIEGGIAGTVNMRTRVPFDQAGDMKALTINYNYGDLSEKFTPEVSGLYSTRWDTASGEFGVLGNLSYSNVNTNSQGAQLSRLSRFRNVYDGVPLAFIPDGTNFRDTTFDRTREGVALAAQWKNVDQTLEATVQFNRSQYENDMEEYVISSSFGNPAFGKSIYYEFGPSAAPKPASGTAFTFDKNGMFQSGTMMSPIGSSWYGQPKAWGGSATSGFNAANANGDSIYPLCYLSSGGGDCDGISASDYDYGYRGPELNSSTRYSTNKNMTQDIGFKLKWEPTDRLHVNFDVQYVDSTVKSYDITADFNTYTNPDIDLTGSLPKLVLNMPTNINLTSGDHGSSGIYDNPSNYFIHDIMDHMEDSKGHEFAFRADVKYDLENGWAKSLKVGARYADREQNVNWSKYNWQNVANDWTGCAPGQEDADKKCHEYGAQYWNLTQSSPAVGVNGFAPGPFKGYPTDFYSLRKWTSGFGSVSTGEGVGDTTFVVANTDLLKNRAQWASVMSASSLGLTGGAGWDPICSNTGDRADEVAGTCFRPAEMNQVSEKSDAVYAQLNFGGDDLNLFGKPLSGNFGARFVRTTIESTGGESYPAYTNQLDCTFDEVKGPGGVGTGVFVASVGCAVSADDKKFINGAAVIGTSTAVHNNLLPSLNFKYEFADEWQARLALSRAMSRPDIGNLKHYLGVSFSLPSTSNLNDPLWIKDAQGNITGANVKYTGDANNPYLKPILADQIDISIENYFAKVGSFTVTAFAKQFHDYIQMSSYYRTLTNDGVSRQVEVKAPANGDGAKISGVEFAYQRFFDFLPDPFNGLGVQTNFTYVNNKGITNTNISNVGGDGGAGTNGGQAPDSVGVDALEGLSKYAANFVLMYEKDEWAARLAYSWRSKYLQTAYDCCVSVPIWTEASGQLDGSIKYSWNENVDIAFQASNLLNEKTVLTQQVTDSKDGALRLPNAWFQNDRRFTLGLRLKY